MATATSSCGICDHLHVTKPSVAWCLECDEGFCSGCVEHHSLAKASRHHKTIPISEYHKLPEDVLQIPQSCTKHDEKFLLYCKDHEMPCCGKCAIEVHKGCIEVVNLDDIIKNAKTSTSFQEIEETLDEVTDNIKEIQKLYRENITSLSENRKQIEKQILEIRFKIDTHLNQVQKKLVDRIQEVEETERRKVSQLVKTLEEKENNLTKYQNSIANIKQHASDLQTFMSIKQIEQDLANEEEFIQSCLDGDKVNIRVIISNIDESVETIMKNVQKFGEIAVELKPTKAALRERKKKQAQIFIPKIRTKTIENVTALLQQTIKTTSTNVRGCCILPDGRMAFTCFKRDMLILIKSDGSKDFEIPLPSAFDVLSGTKDNTVIVSSSFSNSGISIVDIQDRKIKKFIPLDSNCYGLVERNGHVICCSKSQLNMLNLQTETVNTITSANVSFFSYVDTNGKNIYYTSYYGHSVTCCDFQGAIKWTFKDENILFPQGISVDNDDFLFVLFHDSVVLISPCGKQHRTLLSSSNGFFGAQALHYNKTTDMLLVAHREEKAFLYTIDRN